MYGYNNYNYRYNNRKKFNPNIDQIKRDFMNYANPQTKLIDIERYQKIADELGIDLENDLFMVYFLYKCNAKKMERITEDEYITGLKAFEVNTLTEVKSKIMNFREDMLEINTPKFRDFYNFLFDINVDAKDNIERKKKKMPLDIVESYFNSLFVSQF